MDAARHCCVCHHSKGVKVEVHHIVPESQGGANEIENAITLCFDCHADAGHYNPSHPRGTKFSPNELRRHRDEWHAMVRQHAIRSPDDPDFFYCRYLLCKSFDAFREITLGELSHVPATHPFLVSNSVRGFQREIIDRHPQPYRLDQVWGEAFDDRESYSRAHPEVQLLGRSSMDLYPYFEAIRVPAREELRERVVAQDAVTRLLIDSAAPTNEIAMALAYEEVCGRARFKEIYRLRPLWALYFAATNVSDRPLSLSGIEGETDTPRDVGYRPLGHRLSRENGESPLPAAPLPQGATLLAPIATLLGPMTNINPVTLSEKREDLPSRQRQIIAHQDLAAVHEETSLIGPAFWPRSLRIRGSSTTLEQPIHEFDLSNLYTIDRFWEAGSCPHLFATTPDSRFPRYLGELFARQAGRSQTERVIVPAGIRALVIAELETERTTIEEIRVNETRRISLVDLERGDVLWVPVEPGDVVDLRGYYTAAGETAPDPWLRNCIIGEFMSAVSTPLDT